MDLLTALAEAGGPPGREERVRAVVEPELAAVCDRVERDPLGGLIGVRGEGELRLMLAAHMDEIGLMVTHVDDRGFLRVLPLGGWDARTLLSQRVLVHGREDLEGVVGTTPVHLLDKDARRKVPEVSELAVDVGLPAERVRELVRAGDVITRIRDLRRLGDLVTAKSLDDRVGVLVMIEALRAAGPSPAQVVAAATVQEEVGLRGSRVAAARVRPHVALAIDTCPANDGPGRAGRRAPRTRLGRGRGDPHHGRERHRRAGAGRPAHPDRRGRGHPPPVPRRRPGRDRHGQPAALRRRRDRRLRLDPDPLRPLERRGRATRTTSTPASGWSPP